VRILHIAYRLEESSAATRLAQTQDDRHQLFFFLGRLSKATFVRKRQVYPYLGMVLGVALHLLEILVSKLCKTSEEEIFSFGLLGLPQRLLLKRIVTSQKIDLIHLHWGGYSFFPLSAAFNLSVPFVTTAHDYGLFTGGCHLPMGCRHWDEGCHACPLTNSKVTQSYIHHARSKKIRELRRAGPVVTAPSRYTALRIAEVYPFLAATVIGNTAGGFDACSAKSLYQEARPSRAAVPTIITVGANRSARQNKGQDVLEYVLANLTRAGVEFNYISVGKFEPYEGVTRRVHFDRVGSEELNGLYCASDLCLVPSRYETFSQVTLEAILCGTPVVAFDNSGPCDIVTPGETGFLVPAFDQEQFFRTVQERMDFKFANRDLVLARAEQTAATFAPGAVSRAFDEVYHAALGAPAGAASPPRGIRV
jgi:glycosyltransferase involved in cell wall biosynthesis